jgi:chemotaxis methyl-accepting protein methylase
VIRIDDIKFDSDYYDPLIHLLTNTTGLNLDYYRKNFIEKRIKSRMIRVNCETLESYYNYLLENTAETNKFFDCFNINYSVFFRNWEVFLQFEKILLSSLYLSNGDITSNLTPNPERQYRGISKRYSQNNQKPYKKIKNHRLNFIDQNLYQTSLYKKIWKSSGSEKCINIWSCPCANGEEPYSIAMILDNLKRQILEFPKFRIIASDIDNDAINRAKTGIYNEDSTREVSKFYENKYFKKEKGNFGFSYSIIKEIKKQVEFIVEDVTRGHQTLFKYDIIFCRYLLIYISRKTREQFLNILRRSLNPGGLLILGKTEALNNFQGNLKLIDSYNRIYMKEGVLYSN